MNDFETPPNQSSLIAQIQAAANDYSLSFLEEVVPLFIETIHDAIAELQKALAEGDQAAAQMAAHRCKGDCEMAGMKESANIFRQIEKLIKANQLNQALQQLPEIIKQFEAAELELKSYIDYN